MRYLNKYVYYLRNLNINKTKQKQKRITLIFRYLSIENLILRYMSNLTIAFIE